MHISEQPHEHETSTNVERCIIDGNDLELELISKCIFKTTLDNSKFFELWKNTKNGRPLYSERVR